MVALLGALVACQSTATGPAPASEARAERAARQGNHAEAGRMYEELARNNAPPARDELAMSAARAWLDAGRADDAQRALALSATQLPAAQAFNRDLLRAEVGAARGQYQAALQQLAQLAEPTAAPDAARLAYLRQQLALRAGQPLEGVRAGMARDRLAADEASRTRARRDLLIDLRAAIDRGTRVDPAAARDAIERGWLEIAQIAATAGRNPLGANSLVAGWRQRFPGHPASTVIASEILDPAGRSDAALGSTVAPGPVALLLPLADRRAALVRDGFQAATARLPEAGRFELRVYDTSAQSVAIVMQRAVADGAALLVGPLTRDEVQTAAAQRPASVPVLLLNTLPSGGGPGLWQFALAPEDEARQIARQITGNGGRGVVVFAPADDWGRRVTAAFTAELREAGGTVIAEGLYGTDSQQFEATVRRTLGVDAGRERRRVLQSLTGRELQYSDQPAPGIDAIFVAGYQSLALRQINPWLARFSAGDIPTYMTSDGLGDDRAANLDLNGMRVLETPWLIDTSGTAADVRQATAPAWSTRASGRDSRLFAFGYDAAMLASSLRGNAVVWPLDGVTGRLSLMPDGRISRTLNWARVQDGVVQPTDPFTP